MNQTNKETDCRENVFTAMMEGRYKSHCDAEYASNASRGNVFSKEFSPEFVNELQKNNYEVECERWYNRHESNATEITPYSIKNGRCIDSASKLQKDCYCKRWWIVWNAAGGQNLSQKRK